MFEMMQQVCGLACSSDDTQEEYSFVGLAREGETPYTFSSRLLESGQYTRVTTVPLWRLPEFARAWQQFLDRNRASVPHTRQKLLHAMSAEARREWAESTHAELTAFCVYVQRYLNKRQGNQQRRHRRGTETDERYDQFQVLAADILTKLAEIQAEAEAEEQG